MEILEQFGINGKLLLVQMINFAVLLFLLKKFLYKPLTDILEKRRTAVTESMETAEKMKEEKENLEKQVQEELQKAKKQAAEIVASADAAATKLTASKTAEARATAEKIVEDAKQAIASEKKTIMDSVRDDVVNLVIAGTEKVLGKTVKGQKTYAKETIEKIKK